MYVFQISRKNVDYGSGQIKYTLLQAKAINKISEEEEVWYKTLLTKSDLGSLFNIFSLHKIYYAKI